MGMKNGEASRMRLKNKPATPDDKSLTQDQRIHDGPVGGGEIIAAQLSGRRPGDCHVFVRMGRGGTRSEGTNEGNHRDDNGAIVVNEGREGAGDRHFAPELFADFADNGGARFLTGFDLPAGKFPFQGHELVRRPLGDQDAALLFDYGADDRNGAGRIGNSCHDVRPLKRGWQ